MALLSSLRGGTTQRRPVPPQPSYSPPKPRSPITSTSGATRTNPVIDQARAYEQATGQQTFGGYIDYFVDVPGTLAQERAGLEGGGFPSGYPVLPDTGGGGSQQGGGGGGGYYSGGGGGGGASAPAPLTWSEGYNVEGAPEWWQGLVPSLVNPATEVAFLTNAMIPFMSPEDQRQSAQNLARQFPDAFGAYNPLTNDDFGPIPTEIDTGLRDRFRSANRAQGALGALSAAAEAAGKTPDELGPGFGFLQQVLDVMRDFGGGGDFFGGSGTNERQSRQETAQMLGALDPLLAEAKGQSVGAFGQTARALAQPFFSGGQLIPVQRNQAGEFIFGEPRGQWF